MAGTTTINPTGNDYIDGLVQGVKWTSGPTYSVDWFDYEQSFIVHAVFAGSYEILNDWRDGESYYVYGTVSNLANLVVRRAPPVGWEDQYPIYKNTGNIRISNSPDVD